MQDVVIVGEAVAGESAKTRKALEKAIKQVNMSTFDIIELLHKVRSGRMYTTPTFDEYLKTLDINLQKAKYLTDIGEFMETIHCTRAEAEACGVTKMRIIKRLDPKATYTNPMTKETVPMIEYIWGFIQNAHTYTSQKMEEDVRILKGEIGDNDVTWLNIRLTRLVKTNIVEPAFEKAGLNIGDVGKDSDGVAIPASDALKLEVICVRYNQDISEDPEVSQ